MDTSEIRKDLHNKIDSLDEKSLKAIYSMFKDYFGTTNHFELTEEHKVLINDRLSDYDENPDSVISWEESGSLLKKYL